jgi:hypothetical protein
VTKCEFIVQEINQNMFPKQCHAFLHNSSCISPPEVHGHAGSLPRIKSRNKCQRAIFSVGVIDVLWFPN